MFSFFFFIIMNFWNEDADLYAKKNSKEVKLLNLKDCLYAFL